MIKYIMKYYMIGLRQVNYFQSHILYISDVGALWCHGLWYMPSIY